MTEHSELVERVARQMGDATNFDGKPFSTMLAKCELEKLAAIAALSASPVTDGETAERAPPNLLTDEEGRALLTQAEELWADLQQNQLGGFSGINRPFYILHEFRRVIEQYGGRDVGLRWTTDELAALKPEEFASGICEGEK